jgi:hypothetical protein
MEKKILNRVAFALFFFALALAFAILAYWGFGLLFVYRETGGAVGTIRYWVFQLAMWGGFFGAFANMILAVRVIRTGSAKESSAGRWEE